MRSKIFSSLMVLAMLSAASVAWAGDGYNYFEFAYGNSPDDTLSDAIIRGVHAGSDLDGDGKYEIIVTDYNPNSVHVYEVVGNDSIEWVWSSATVHGTSYIRQVHTGDIDNDGIGEIIFVATDGTVDPSYEGGIHVYEWDGVTDNGYPDSATSIYKPNPSHTETFRSEDFAIGDIDGDGQNEMVVVDNTQTNSEDGCYILSVTGTFESGFAIWNEEAVFKRTGANPFGGSPVNGAIGDMDGDGHKEAIFGIWDFATLYIVEATGINSYAYQTQVKLDSTAWADAVALDNIVVADLNSDGADEVYITMWGLLQLAVCTGGNDVSTITFENNVRHITAQNEAGDYGIALGDQDHGAGTDGPDLYTAYYTQGRVYDHELTPGSDPLNPDNWTRTTLWEDLSGNSHGSYGICAPPVDLDGDGYLEVVVTYLEAIPPEGKWFRVFEWAGEQVGAHDLGVVEVKPTYTTASKTTFEATVQNFGENKEGNFDIYWNTDTGDSDTITYIDTLGSLETADVALGWAHPTSPSMVEMTVWVDLDGDTVANNDTLSQYIYIYPPEITHFTHVYQTMDTADIRGVGLFGPDDYAVGQKSSPYRLIFYHNAPDPPDAFDEVWNDIDTSIAIGYNWGVGIDADSNVYLCNQSADSTAQALVWDYDGNEVDFLKLGYSDKNAQEDELDWPELLAMSQRKDLKGTTYPTALDLDDSGNVYVAWYIEDGTIHDQIEVYPPMASWVNHQATKLTGFEPGAFVVEGLCVNGDGSVVWVTDRSAPGYPGDVTRWSGSPAGGYTQDMSFAGDGELELPGWVRGIDVAHDGDILVCADDDLPPFFAGDKLFIADGTTGELKGTLDIDSPVGNHKNPYDVETRYDVPEKVGEGALEVTAQKAGDDIRLDWPPLVATSFYITHQYGQYVDKWAEYGVKAISYDVYRDTVSDFTPGAGNLLANTSNTYYLDTGVTGSTSVNYYYIVEGTGIFGTTNPSATVGEYDRGLLSGKKKAASERSVIRIRSRAVPAEEKTPPILR